jgi:hypothetical protein
MAAQKAGPGATATKATARASGRGRRRVDRARRPREAGASGAVAETMAFA